MPTSRKSALPEQGSVLPETARALKASGTVEVLRIKRRSRKHPELLLFKGAPASKSSSVRSALITLVDKGSPLPQPSLAEENDRLHVYFHDLEDKDIQALIAEPGAYLWYFWRSFDGSQSHAWLLRAR